MIERYQTQEMKELWSDENKFKTWLKVEIVAVEVLCKHGIVPEASLKVIKNKANFDKDRVLEIEKTTRHDVIAFLTNVAEYVGPDSRYIHMGMTSSDLLDTSMGLQCKEAGEIILEKLKLLKVAISLLTLKVKSALNMFQVDKLSKTVLEAIVCKETAVA